MERYNLVELFKAPRSAIGPQRIALGALGLLAVHIVYLLFSYLAFLISGSSAPETWARFGLLPLPLFTELSTFAIIVFLLGIVICILVKFIAATFIARAAYMALRDNLFYTWKQAIRFALSKWKSITGTYLTFFLMIIPFIIGAKIMAYVGKIPWFGEILNAIATLPYIFSGMILVFLTLGFIVAILFGPVIIASTEEDGYGAAVQALHLTWAQPWRIILYGLLTLGLFLFAIFFFAFILKVGLIIYSILFMPLMHSLSPILDQALYFIQISLGMVDEWIRQMIGSTGSRIFYLKQFYQDLTLPLSTQIASIIVYISLVLAGYIAVGYGWAVWNTSLIISFLIFNKKMTDTNLLERKDSEIVEEEDETLIQPDSDDIKNLNE